MRAEWGRLAAGGASKPGTGGFVMLAGLPPHSPQWPLSRKKQMGQKHRDKRGCMVQSTSECRLGVLKDRWKRQKNSEMLFSSFVGGSQL